VKVVTQADKWKQFIDHNCTANRRCVVAELNAADSANEDIKRIAKIKGGRAFLMRLSVRQNGPTAFE